MYNEVIEKFFVLLQSELFYFEKFESIEDFKEKLDGYDIQIIIINKVQR